MGYPKGPPMSMVVTKEFKMTEAIKLYLDGYSQKQIEEEFGRRGYPTTRSVISRYITETRNEWREKRMDDMEQILEKELAKLDKMEKDAEKLFGTFDPNDTEFDETFDCSKEANEWVKTRLKIMEQRHKLLGLYKPVKVDVESKNVNINANAESTEAIRSEILGRLSKKPE